MPKVKDFISIERKRASAWKLASTTVDPQAKVAAPYVAKIGAGANRPHYDFCLPPEFAYLSLLPEVRDIAIPMFKKLGISWHKGIGDGPSNHLLSSQVQCVNALGQMVKDPARIIAAFGPLVGTTKVEEIEPGHYLTFEYIGEKDLLNEAGGGKRVRGANCTSVDAAFVHTNNQGKRELILIEWKYTEKYAKRPDTPEKDEERRRRYEKLLYEPGSPIDLSRVPFEELLQDPIYQLMRQQLLARQLEKSGAHNKVDRVIVLHIDSKGNTAYQKSVFGDKTRKLGTTVHEVWSKLLKSESESRFMQIDSSIFLDPKITSAEYALRYDPTPNLPHNL